MFLSKLIIFPFADFDSQEWNNNTSYTVRTIKEGKRGGRDDHIISNLKAILMRDKRTIDSRELHFWRWGQIDLVSPLARKVPMSADSFCLIEYIPAINRRPCVKTFENTRPIVTWVIKKLGLRSLLSHFGRDLTITIVFVESIFEFFAGFCPALRMQQADEVEDKLSSILCRWFQSK